MSRQLKCRNGKISQAGTFIRYGFLSILFIIGLCAIVATTGDQPGQNESLFMNPYKMATGKNSEEINRLLRELNWAEYQLANLDDPYDNGSHLREKISKLKAQIASLGHKVELYSSGCFTPDMWVLTEDGAKPIPEINVGDKVLSYDDNGHQVMAEVLNTYETKNNHYYLINGKIKVTAQHRFFSDGGWKKAKDLEVGDLIQTATGKPDQIVSIEWRSVDLDVYNLTISKNHNFYVSPDGKDGYLVHNTAGGGGGGGDGSK